MYIVHADKDWFENWMEVDFDGLYFEDTWRVIAIIIELHLAIC